MSDELKALSEDETAMVVHMALAEVNRLRDEVDRQRGKRKNGIEQIRRLSIENVQLIEERDEARAAVQMHAHASAYQGELELIAQDLGVEGIGEIRDAILRFRAEYDLMSDALNEQLQNGAKARRVIEMWRAYRAQAHVKEIDAFYALADALDALAQTQPQVTTGEEQVS